MFSRPQYQYYQTIFMPQGQMTVPAAGQNMMQGTGLPFPQLYDGSWRHILGHELNKDYMKILETRLDKEYSEKQVFPPKHLVFNAFNLTPFNEVKVVILGQDPYPSRDKASGLARAMGLAFSVQEGITTIPLSLKNIYIELANDIPNFTIPNHGCLVKWANQGVLLLNSVLTVEAGNKKSHSNWGWEHFTNQVIRLLSTYRVNLVFILMGNLAHKKALLIDNSLSYKLLTGRDKHRIFITPDPKHFIMMTGHPSPLSFRKYCYGCGAFSWANQCLITSFQSPIDWTLHNPYSTSFQSPIDWTLHNPYSTS